MKNLDRLLTMYWVMVGTVTALMIASAWFYRSPGMSVSLALLGFAALVAWALLGMAILGLGALWLWRATTHATGRVGVRIA